MKKKIRIGDLLVQSRIITEDQLLKAIQVQKAEGHKLGQVLVDLGFTTEEQMLLLLADQLRLPYVDLATTKLDPQVVRLLPESQARSFQAIVIEQRAQGLLVGMVDPADIFAYDELAHILKLPLQLALIQEDTLLKILDSAYGHGGTVSDFAAQLSDEFTDQAIDLAHMDGDATGEDAPVVKLLQSLFETAVNAGASDIHIEPEEQVLRIRQRVDGVLQEQVMKESNIAPALTQRLKIMAGLDIAEQRLPQDGRFHVKVTGVPVDVRLSTLPTRFGESVVLRLLNQSDARFDFEQLGMDPAAVKTLRHHIQRPHGLILVTGPTGSGKTTTLYATLNELNQAGNKIITVEDPVEYEFSRVTQVQVNHKVHLDFPVVLRSMLRQDPDIIMVGEIRDEDTANIALRAAMTGHLVLATLHTNDAVSSVMRLVDMGVPRYLVAAAVKVVMAQRLIRRLCAHCSDEYQPTEQEMGWILQMLGTTEQQRFKQGMGCEHCHGTGYKGRLGVYEMLVVNNALAVALRDPNPQAFHQAVDDNPHHQSLGKAALDYALAGHTSLEEVFRVAYEWEEQSPGLPATDAHAKDASTEAH